MGKVKISLSDAIALAVKHHGNQLDKSGELYILHPLRVMLKFNEYNLQIVAILHDILEDTDITAEYLSELGVTDECLQAIIALTRKDNSLYIEYIINLRENALAKQVKIEDLKDNLLETRIAGIPNKLINRYNMALTILSEN